MLDQAERRAIRDSVLWVGRLSDGLVRWGPFGIGVDGLLSWIPGAGEVYSTVAAAFILLQGARAGVAAPTLALCAFLMGGRTIISAIPLMGPALADLLTAHSWSARIIAGAIDRAMAAEGPTIFSNTGGPLADPPTAAF